MSLSVSIDRRDGLTVVLVTGEVDYATVDRLEEQLAAATNDPDASEILVDLSGVNFLDSGGIKALLQGRRLADAGGRGYRVTGAQQMVLHVLRITGVWSHLSEQSSST